mmetsp:Transcript_21601/g.56099  ORF Transcript_21601/g.56099 Transcript_21601/m.56099 type:complete len:170 (-) Transcript_21601:623-1132(-)
MYFSMDRENKKPLITSCVAGVLFGAAWFLFAAQAARSHGNLNPVSCNSSGQFTILTPIAPTFPLIGFVDVVPGLIASLGLFMINLVSLKEIKDESGMGGDSRTTRMKIWLFFSIIVTFSSLAAAIAIFVTKYVNCEYNTPCSGTAPANTTQYPFCSTTCTYSQVSSCLL